MKDMILHYWLGQQIASLWHFCVGSYKVESDKLMSVKLENGNFKGKV